MIFLFCFRKCCTGVALLDTAADLSSLMPRPKHSQLPPSAAKRSYSNIKSEKIHGREEEGSQGCPEPACEIQARTGSLWPCPCTGVRPTQGQWKQCPQLPGALDTCSGSVITDLTLKHSVTGMSQLQVSARMLSENINQTALTNLGCGCHWITKVFSSCSKSP